MLQYKKKNRRVFFVFRKKTRGGLFFRCLLFACGLHTLFVGVFVIVKPRPKPFEPTLELIASSEGIADSYYEKKRVLEFPQEALEMLSYDYERKRRGLAMRLLRSRWERALNLLKEKEFFIYPIGEKGDRDLFYMRDFSLSFLSRNSPAFFLDPRNPTEKGRGGA